MQSISSILKVQFKHPASPRVIARSPFQEKKQFPVFSPRVQSCNRRKEFVSMSIAT